MDDPKKRKLEKRKTIKKLKKRVDKLSEKLKKNNQGSKRKST